MKTLFALLIPVLSFAQPPKGTNTILVHGVTYKQAVSAALDKGLQIDRHDDSLQTFSTVPKTDKNGISHIFYIRVKDSTAIITGTFNLNMTLGSSMIKQETGYDPIQYSGWRTGAFRINFEYMNEYAMAVGTSVTYATN